MTAAVESVDEIARFLAGYPPFDAMGEEELRALAATATPVQVEHGGEIFAQGAAARDSTYVVRSGAVELVDGEQVIDLLGPGEVFGHRSMMTGLPTSVGARAGEDTLLYRLAGEVARPLLARPEGMRFVVRSLRERYGAERASQGPATDLLATHVGHLVREPPLTCRPDETIRAAAERMTAAGQSAIVVELPGGVGLMTDSDLRAKVVCGPLTPDDRVEAAMTAPATTVDAGRDAGEVMLDMLDRGLKHMPVTGGDGRVIGVLRAVDLLAAQARTPFLLREAIATAATVEELATAAAGRTATALAVRDAGLDARHVGAVLAVVDDAITRRLVTLATEEAGPPPGPVAWLVFGSAARRETALSSDLDCGLVWLDAEAAPWAAALAATVLDGLRRCGLRLDDHGVRADNPLVARPLERWRALVDELAGDPWQDNAIALIKILADQRAVTGPPDAAGLPDLVREAAARPQVERLLLRAAVEQRPDGGLLQHAIRLPVGGRRRRFDAKERAIAPICDIARWAGIVAGVRSLSTPDRLRGAADDGVLAADDARALEEAHLLLSDLRLEHQARQIAAGETPDDELDPEALDPLTRSYVRDALRVIAHVQRRLAGSMRR
jgi:CBS domain-containing protein